MKYKIKLAACILSALTITSSALAAGTAQLSIAGTIKPASCTPAIAGGNVIDYGNISPNVLNPAAYTVLPERQVEFTIKCDAPARLALKSTDGRSGTAVGGNVGVGGFIPTPVAMFDGASAVGSTGAAGLGKTGETDIGGFVARIAAGTVKADDKEVYSILSKDHGHTWVTSGQGNLFQHDYVELASWSASSSVHTPVAFTNLTGKLGIQAYIRKSSELDMSKEITLDGLATIELVYL